MGSSSGCSTTSLGRPRMVVVHGATSARRSRGMATSRDSTTTGMPSRPHWTGPGTQMATGVNASAACDPVGRHGPGSLGTYAWMRAHLHIMGGRLASGPAGVCRQARNWADLHIIGGGPASGPGVYVCPHVGRPAHHPGGTPRRARHPATRRSHTTARGGQVTGALAGMPCQGWSVALTPPRLPMLAPP